MVKIHGVRLGAAAFKVPRHLKFQFCIFNFTDGCFGNARYDTVTQLVEFIAWTAPTAETKGIIASRTYMRNVSLEGFKTDTDLLCTANLLEHMDWQAILGAAIKDPEVFWAEIENTTNPTAYQINLKFIP